MKFVDHSDVALSENMPRQSATSFPGSLLFTSQGAPWDVKRRDPGNEVGQSAYTNFAVALVITHSNCE